MLVRVEASNGVIGWGQIYAGGWQSAVVALDHSVAPLVLGQDVSDIALAQLGSPHGTSAALIR